MGEWGINTGGKNCIYEKIYNNGMGHIIMSAN